jgi:osmotically-inducible protein OsmY
MRNRNMISALVTGALALATTNLTAQGNDETLPPQPSYQGQDSRAKERASAPISSLELKASSIIGLLVRNETGVRLGKVQDLIVNMGAHTVPFAIVEYGGTLGIGQTRVAVPITDLKWSGEPNQLILTATKEEFEAATTAPTGGWMAVAGEDWLRNVDRYYGQPSLTSQSRYERQESTDLTGSREAVRNPAEPNGASRLMNQPPAPQPATKDMLHTPSDSDILAKASGVIHDEAGADASDIKLSIKNGVLTLDGKVANQAQKVALEKHIKALPGVERVENNLQTPQE